MIRALAFLTVAGSGATPDGRTMRWFPVAGAAIGGPHTGPFRGMSFDR